MEKEFYKAADKNLTACVLLSGRADICTIHQSKCWERKILLNIKSVDDIRTIFKFLHVTFTLREYEKPGKKSAKLLTAVQHCVSIFCKHRTAGQKPGHVATNPDVINETSGQKTGVLKPKLDLFQTLTKCLNLMRQKTEKNGS